MLQQNMIRDKKMLIGLLLLYIAVHIVYTKLVLRLFDMPMRLSVMLQMASYIVIGGVGVFLFSEKIREGIQVWKECWVKNILFLFGAFILDIFLSNIACLPIMLLNPEYESINEHSVAELHGQFPTWLLIIGLGIMGPVTEEVVFRLIPAFLCDRKVFVRGVRQMKMQSVFGSVGRRHFFMQEKMMQIIGIFVSAIIFMLIHINGFTPEEFLYNLPQFVAGMIYGTVMVFSRNATIPILLHIMNNLPAVMILLLTQ